MKHTFGIVLVGLSVLIVFGGIIQGSFLHSPSYIDTDTESVPSLSSDEYGIQWKQSYGTDPREGARYEGPQPIGDCDNDGLNELLISGRDAAVRVMEWNEERQTYDETHIIRNPFYPFVKVDAGGMAIGDLTGDGKNEIACTWYAAVYRYFAGGYRLIGFNPWVFWRGGGSADCFIGDCDNDGRNELLLTGGATVEGSPVTEITVFRWTGFFLRRVAQWDDPDVYGYVFMPSVADVDEDGENEVICGSAFKVVVLDWNKETKEFDSTILEYNSGWDNYPFAMVCKDSDMDGKPEIHVGYRGPRISIFEWNESRYEKKFETDWFEQDEGWLIEGLDVGDVDDDGIAEVCAGTDIVHILQWNGTTYIEEAVLPTFGDLAVVAVGDCDNDGKNEINVGSVEIDPGEEFMEWIFKYGWDDS